jgi:hypothetical protein
LEQKSQLERGVAIRMLRRGGSQHALGMLVSARGGGGTSLEYRAIGVRGRQVVEDGCDFGVPSFVQRALRLRDWSGSGFSVFLRARTACRARPPEEQRDGQ